MTTRRRLAAGLGWIAAQRLRRRHPDWADAMMSEQQNLPEGEEPLAWAWGSLWASFRLSGAPFSLLLAAAIAALVLYQWSSDESLITVAFVTARALLLGAARPSRSVVSALILGSVVCGVNAFETASGVRPVYEQHLSSWAHDAVWLWFVAPAMAGAAVGRKLGASQP